VDSADFDREDGDSRVAALKQRMEMLKKRREAKAKLGGKGTAA
jgi:zinc finger protein 830